MTAYRYRADTGRLITHGRKSPGFWASMLWADRRRLPRPVGLKAPMTTWQRIRLVLEALAIATLILW